MIMSKVGPFETIFFADAVLFDMDGTLTDSISAVEAAWGLALLSIQDSDNVMVEETVYDDADENWRPTHTQAQSDAWQIEACAIDRAVRVLPGVKKLMDSLPEGRFAVATSGAKTYAHGCMTRVGITPPPVTVTADDNRLKAGKPAPDPFFLAAKELGFAAHRCVVFEDSPSGIKAGVASGAIVIALCTSHERSKIAKCGAHFVLDTMESVKVEVENGRLRFIVHQ